MSNDEVELRNLPYCCCCFSGVELLNMLEPQNHNGEMEVYSTIVTDCYGIEIKIGTEEVYKELLVMCKMCVSRLKDAFQFKHQVQNAYNRIQNYVYNCTFSRVKLKRIVNNSNIDFDQESTNNEEIRGENISLNIKDENISLNIKDEIESLHGNNYYIGSNSNSTHKQDTSRSYVWVNPDLGNSKNFLTKKKEDELDLTCEICNRTFLKYKNLKQHMTVHFSDYSCNACSKTFIKKSTLRRHIRHHEEKKILNTCGVCDKIIRGKNSFRRHMKIHDSKNEKGNDSESDTSNLVAEDIDNAQEEVESSIIRKDKKILTQRNKKKIGETRFNIQFKDKFKIEKPSSEEFQIDENDLTCKICNETFTWHRNLKLHMAVHFPNYMCHMCSKTFVTWPSLRIHIQNHENMKTILTCNICNKTCEGSEKLKRHMKTHSDPTCRYRCPKCSERFTNFFQRSAHLINVHKDETKIRHCKLCNKGFKSIGNLKMHVNSVHLKIKKFACEICSMMFFSKNQLKNHMYCHTGQKDFHCNVCKKSFARRKTLTEHMKIHNNIKNFVCNVCNKAFTQKCSLKVHMKTHNKSEEKSTTASDIV